MIKAITTKDAPAAVGSYSQAIEANGILYLAGQIALTPEGKQIDGSITEQTHQVMKNLKAVLAEAELTFSNVVKADIFLTNISDFAEMNEVYASYLSQPYPARATVAVAELPKNAAIEISLIAVR